MLFTVSLQIRLNSIMLHKDVIGFCVVARSPPQPALKNIGLIIRQSRTSLSLVDVSVRGVRSVPVGDVVGQLLTTCCYIPSSSSLVFNSTANAY